MRGAARLALWIAVGLGGALLVGCGTGGYYEAGLGVGIGGTFDDPYYYDDPCCYGKADVENLSPEFVDGFFLSPAASGTWSEELLGLPLAPGDGAEVGAFQEDVYDADAQLEFGDLVQWFEVLILADDVTVFEVY